MPVTREARKANYFQYVDFGFSPWLDKILQTKRREFVTAFIEKCQPQHDETVHDIGASGEEHPASNMLKKLLLNTKRLTALCPGEHGELQKIYPGVHCVRGEGR